jgi:hypothetical protein
VRPPGFVRPGGRERGGGSRAWLRRLASGRRRAARAGAFVCIDRALGDRVGLLVAGLLDRDEAALVDAHVAACHACEEDARSLRALDDVLPALTAEECLRATTLDADGSDGSRRRASLMPSTPTVLAIAGAVLALALVVGWERARDAALLAEVRGLRAEIARVERDAADVAAARAGDVRAGGADEAGAIVPIARIRFPTPPNL